MIRFIELSGELKALESKRKQNDMNQCSFASSYMNAKQKMADAFINTASYEKISSDETKTVYAEHKVKENTSTDRTDDDRDDISSKSTSSRSHDGVFLRPDAVSSMLSNNQHSPNPPSSSPSLISALSTTGSLANRLIKRQSIDSGINLDAMRTTSRIGKSTTRDQLMKLNRFDRSMSLPLSSSCSFLTFNSSNSITTAASSLATAQAADSAAAGIDSAIDSFSLSIDSAIDPNSFYSSGSNTSLSNASLLSPPRRMDFALCK